MADLKTTYLGMEIKNPVIAGASRLTSNVEKIRELEEKGAAAIVCASLFEEQIQLMKYKLDNDMAAMKLDADPEMHRFFSERTFVGPDEHLMWLKKTKEAVSVPVIGSLNAVNEGTWTEYARQIEDTGVDALECNFYFVPGDDVFGADDIESSQLRIMEAVKKAVNIPVSVKLSFFYTNPSGFIKRAAETGVAGFVLFNRLFEPDIDLAETRHTTPLNLSNEGDNRPGLRFAGLLYGNIDAEIILNTGIYTGSDAARAVLSGANTVQVVSALFKYGTGQIAVILEELGSYMDSNDYSSLADFRGKLSRKNINDPFVYKRAQYINLLLKSELLK